MDKIEFLKRRKNFIGGSDISAICGLNKYRTPLDVYLDKKSDEIYEETSEASYFGTLLEDVVAQEYAKRTGNQIMCSDGIIVHPQYSFAAANIDRWVNGKEFILECKTAGFMLRDQLGESGTDQVLEPWIMQCAWYAAVCDVPKVDIAVLIGGQDFRTYTYERNKELEERLIEIGHNFWYNHVLKDIPPQAINVYDTKKLYPQDAGEVVEAPEEIVLKIERLKQIKLEQKEKDKEADALEVEIQSFMKEASTLTAGGKTLVTWKSSKPRVGLDSQKLKELYPSIYIECVKESAPSRPFVIKA